MQRCSLLSCLVVLLSASLYAADDPPAAAGPKYTLKYKFKPGEKLHWDVSHRARIRTIAGGTTQDVETASDSVKVWTVSEVDAQGNTTLVHSVHSVRMRHKFSGREETVVELPVPPDKQIPIGYEGVAGDVGVPLTRITMDVHGGVVKKEDLRQKKQTSTSGYEGPLTLPLQAAPVAVGEKWTNPHTVNAPRKDGTYKQVKIEQRFTLQSVRNDVATIYVESVVLTPVREPEVKIHLVQSKTRGTAKFDIAAGRMIEQDLSLDEEIIGAPLGDASSMHYVMQFTEKFLKEPPQAARGAGTGKFAR
jgi:hypothetical protein